MSYYHIHLSDIVDTLGEDATKKLLSDFSCPKNKDVENFLKTKALPMVPQQVAPTYLIFTEYKNQKVLVGYFTLTTKFIKVSRTNLSSRWKRRLNKYFSYDEDTKEYYMSAPLIAQLGKNFTNGYNKLITGDELLKIACDQVREAQSILGGKFIYLECEDKSKLVEFYESNGFFKFGKREIEEAEKDILDGKYLIQMGIYLSDK